MIYNYHPQKPWPFIAISPEKSTGGKFTHGLGVGDGVVDPRELDTAPALEALMAVWRKRADHRAVLAESLPSTKAIVEEQMEPIQQVKPTFRSSREAVRRQEQGR